ncbi:MAG: MerR family transcriptional regulator [Deltaproteobacteria bacterium]|nr:MerR family transcriptional regulator [Deltaproteobacteria bacterium]
MMMKNTSFMKISELSELTGVSASTIRYYLREGLINPPVRTGKTMAYYDEGHVKQLELIKEIQDGEKLPLRFVKKMMEKIEKETLSGQQGAARTNRREEIIKAAISLFREKGYENTSITDIVDRARVGRGTFYLNFDNKEELFIECADKIFFAMYDDVWQEIKNEKDMIERLKKRGLAFYRSYPQWQDMMNLIRGAAVGKRGPLAEKLKQVMHQIIDPISHDVQRGIEQGAIRDLNSTLVGFMLMGMSEYISYLIYEDEAFDRESTYETVWNILGSGIEKKK